MRGESWKGHLLVADVGDLQETDASEVYLRRVKTKEVLVPKEGDNFIFSFAHGSAKLAGKDSEVRNIRPTLARYRRGRRTPQWSLRRNGRNQILQSNNENKMNCKQSMIPEASFIVIMFKKNKNCTFPFQLKNIDVVMRTNTTLDVLQESQIHD